LSLLPSCLVYRLYPLFYHCDLGHLRTRTLLLIISQLACLLVPIDHSRKAANTTSPLHTPRIDVHSTSLLATRLSLSPNHQKKTRKNMCNLSTDETSNPVLQSYAPFLLSQSALLACIVNSFRVMLPALCSRIEAFTTPIALMVLFHKWPSTVDFVIFYPYTSFTCPFYFFSNLIFFPHCTRQPGRHRISR